MAVDTLEILLRARDQASETLKNVKGNIKQMVPAAKIAKGALIGLGGAFGAVAFAGLRSAARLDDAMASFSARTGVVGEEAGEVADILKKMFKVNTESFEELADTAAVLRQQWELSTDQLQDTVQAFLDFAKITRQKAEPATKALSLALKGFGRDVEDVGIVSDTLIASQQRFGISTAETTRILGENAGTFAALGLSMEDAIALLSALAANGVNTSRAVMGLRSSIDAFESPEEFQAALQDLAGIENATERAKAAMRSGSGNLNRGISGIAA